MSSKRKCYGCDAWEAFHKVDHTSVSDPFKERIRMLNHKVAEDYITCPYFAKRAMKCKHKKK